jgi:hypothetical protein
MKHYLNCFILLSVMVSGTAFSAPLTGNNSYWQCTTEDKTNKQWTAKSGYQKMALNLSYDACKKQSQYPDSCKASNNNCEGFYLGMSTKPLWRCTALDRTAIPWQSNFYSQRDDAALAAQAFCKNKSTVPETCYVNMVTCRNLNEGNSL